MRSAFVVVACVALLVACPPPRAAAPIVEWTGHAPRSHRSVSATCAPHHSTTGNPPLAKKVPSVDAGASAEPNELRLDDDREDCANDSECIEQPGGFCELAHVGKGLNRLRCRYDACVSDVDCGERGACVCRENRAHGCVLGDCKVDLDCGAPGFCAYSMGGDVMTPYGRVMDKDRGYFCRTLRDTCINDEDCLDERCAFVSERRHWECRPVNSADAP